MSKTEQNHNFIKLSPIIIYLFFAVIITGISSPKAELASKAEMDLVCQNWLAQIVHEQGNWAGQANPKVIRVEEFRSGDTLLATIHHIDPTGFILIPVLKEMVPIKAYSDKYNLDESQENGFLTLIRELFSSYLNLYIDNYGSLNQRQSLDNQIFDPKQKDEWMRLLQPGNEFKSSLLETRDRDAVEVGPLLTTSWHQKYPYNINSPIGSGGICDVGCVATAMAQILKHWEWPPRGSSNYTYYWGGDYSCGEPYTSGEFVTADLTNDYDWVNMPDSCDLGCSTVEVEALAEINFEAGVACRMQYGHCNSSAWHLGGSVEAYQKHFCYSREIQTAYRGDFTQEEWYQIIKEEIDNNRPIHYGISGHSIACDGYQDDGFGLYRYHLNYGWGNSYNTWFIFDNLSCPWVTGGICPVPDQDITYNIIPQTEPIIKAWGYLFSNTTSGSDLYLLPGDNADLDILIKNEGWDGTGMHVELVSLDPNIVVISQTISFGESILWNEIDTTESSFSISIDESSPNPYTAKLELQITGDNGYATFDTVSIFTGNVTGYTSNFETDTTGWAHVEKTRGYGDQWHYSDFDAFSGSNCWKFGGSGSDPYDPYTDGYLLSPWILLGDNSVLSFQHRMDAQGGEGWAADCGYVMISTTEDNTWKTISPKDGYPNFAASHNTLLLEEDDPCFSSNFDWKEELFDLSEFSGASRIVFRFTTDASVDLEGWYIDDFTITNSVCGDAEQDGLINILDIVFLINYKYKDGPAPFPLGIGDVNHDTEIDILDIVYLVNSVYKNGPEPEC